MTNVFFQKVLISGLMLMLSFFVTTCAAEKDAARPGMCALKCSNSVIGGGQTTFPDPNVRIRLVTKLEGMGCAVDKPTDEYDFGGPVTLHFLAERKVTAERGEGLAESDVAAGGIYSPAQGWVSIPNMAIEPIVLGGILSIKETAQEFKVTNPDTNEEEVEPYEYVGVVTPKDQWCSDSCGVIALQIWPKCVGGITNNIALAVHSGSLYSEVVGLPIEAKKRE